MAVKPSFQDITTFCTNNTGKDLSAYHTDFFADGCGTELDRHAGAGNSAHIAAIK